ncbi:MAG TPA: tRNA lysidine(34) synthetase TilS [Bacteroidia bacterium]|jgi:tRNA(Ile)-lysidine synthase
MHQDLLNYITEEKLFGPADKVLLTVSGGIDSVVMCALFHKAGLSFGIAHCNFQLRGEESEADELLTEELAEKYGVQFHSISFDTSAVAKKNKLSIQAAARQLRYQWFEEIREQYKYKAIATAHHQDDSVETFFINLVRGTGISGLHGILPKQGKIIRPMLFTTKKAIEAYAKKNKIKYREDSSNASDKYARNKIRHHLIPVLKELNPNLEQTIQEDIQRLHETEIIYKKEIDRERSQLLKETKGGITISIEKLKKLNPLSAYLYEFLKTYHFNGSHVKDVIHSLNGISGKQFFSETHRLIKDRRELIIEPINRKEEAKEGKKVLISENSKAIIVDGKKIIFHSVKAEKHQVKKSNTCANLDFDLLTFPLEIRKWKTGDAFYPLGMRGKKKLSDFFIDRKFSLDRKENIWLLTSAGKIVWVIGERIDDRFKITDKTSKIYFAEQV